MRDEVLVQRAQSGDRDALVILYRRYVKEIYGYLLNQLGDVRDAEDVTSETFLRFISAVGGFRTQSSFRTWLYAIARNQLRDHWRRNGRRPATVDLDDSSPAAPVEEPALPSPRATELGRAVLAQLPDNYRRVVELRILDGRSVRDTAEELGLSPGNVKVLQHRGLKRASEIAQQLAEAGENHRPDAGGARRAETGEGEQAAGEVDRAATGGVDQVEIGATEQAEINDAD